MDTPQTTYDNLSSITIKYPVDILVPELQNIKKLEKKHYFNFVNSKQMIKYLWSNIENITYQESKHNYWNIDELEWSNNIPNL
jgi:hypothetical protein